MDFSQDHYIEKTNTLLDLSDLIAFRSANSVEIVLQMLQCYCFLFLCRCIKSKCGLVSAQCS